MSGWRRTTPPKAKCRAAGSGSGMAGIDGLDAGDVVTAEQMKALFGLGLHPLAAERWPQLERPDSPTRPGGRPVGAPFRVYANDVSPFQVAVARRFAQSTRPPECRRMRRSGRRCGPGSGPRWPPSSSALSMAGRRRMPREISGTIAKLSRPRTDAVAGYDLTFSPVKSVSTLWAVADPHVAAVDRIRPSRRRRRRVAVHRSTTPCTPGPGRNGVRQVDVRGLVAAAFVHRDSRAGDPDLHTHVAVANKVQTLDGRWLSIDGRLLFKATVAASESYNTALEAHLTDRLGVRFAERPNPDPRKRPVREIVGVDPRLNQRWSSRGPAIEARTGRAGRPVPGRPRPATHPGRDASNWRSGPPWRPGTRNTNPAPWPSNAPPGGSRPARFSAATRRSPPWSPARCTDRVRRFRDADAEWVRAAAGRVLEAMETRRSTWQVWHVHAEALRQIRAPDLPPDQVEQLVDRLTAEVLEHRSTRLARPADGVDRTGVLRRRDGASRLHRRRRRPVHLPRSWPPNSGSSPPPAAPTAGPSRRGGRCGVAGDGRERRRARRRPGRAGAGDGDLRRPAAAGDRPRRHRQDHRHARPRPRLDRHRRPRRRPGPLRRRRRAAAGADRAPTDTLAKLAWSIDPRRPARTGRRGSGRDSLVVIDEAGMADTITLDTAVDFVVGRGGSVRLVGDDQQLAAVGAGGVLRDIAATHGAVRLTELHRFTDPAEAAATLALRDGRPEALGFYLDHDRIHVGDLTTSADQLYAAWKADRNAGLDALMLAPTRELAAQLNQRARADRLAGRTGRDAATVDAGRREPGQRRRRDHHPPQRPPAAHQPHRLGEERRPLDRHRVHRDGGLTVQHSPAPAGSSRLPADYVTGQVELGYATTVHAAQGVTADTMHGLVTGDEARQQLYTMATRGRTANHLYLHGRRRRRPALGDPARHHPPRHRRRRLLKQILARDDAARPPRPPTATCTIPPSGSATPPPATRRPAHRRHTTSPPELVERIDAGRGTDQRPGSPASRPGPPCAATCCCCTPTATTPSSKPRAAARRNSTPRTTGPPSSTTASPTATISASGPLPWLPGIVRPDSPTSPPGAHISPAASISSPIWLRRYAQKPQPICPIGRLISTARYPTLSSATSKCGEPPTRSTPTTAAPPDRLSSNRPRAIGRCGCTKGSPPVTPASTTGPEPSLGSFPPPSTDPFSGDLAQRLARLTQRGYDTRQLLRAAVDLGPLSDEHPTMAIWWRILDQVSKDATPTTNNKHSQPKRPYQVSSRQAPNLLPDRQPPPPQPGPSR